jgi:FkbM family methyltransferase
MDPDWTWATLDPQAAAVVRVRSGIKQCLLFLGWDLARSAEWLNAHAEPLWESRSLLDDAVSRLIFDEALVLRLAGHRKFYFPPTDFDDLVEIVDEQPFQESDLPWDYVGLPLKTYSTLFTDRRDVMLLKVVAHQGFIHIVNRYRQYFLRRHTVDVSPVPGNVVLDCGACIGDVSVLFAGLAGGRGEVHVFDPIPLHGRFCRFQASLNPALAPVLHIHELAVSNRTYRTSGENQDSGRIAPGGLSIDSFSSTRLDDYARGNLSRVDYIKMDIEGAEMDALEGAAGIIREWKPRLAISAYHRPQDLWEIPIRLKALNPGYRLFFGHHSPTLAESVFYAVHA